MTRRRPLAKCETMIELKFPDGSVRSYDQDATGRDVARSIAPSLEKRAVLVKIDGELYDLDRDPYEMKNLIDDPACAEVRQTLRVELARLVAVSVGL